METFLGVLLCATGGLAGAVFALPFRGIRSWKYESYWFLYALVGLVIFPIVLARMMCPNVFDILSSADHATLARCVGFGALWGLGGLTWGLMIRYLGIGLGLAIGCGLCSATGTLIPPLVTGHASDLVKDTSSVVTLVSVMISLVGIVFVGCAGRFKESELDEEQKRAAVKEFNFKKGILVALFSGVASAGMNFGLQSGAALETMAREAGVANAWCGMPVLVAVLAGGFVVNAAWCFWQNARNHSFGDYRLFNAAWLLAPLAGVIWTCQFVCQKVSEPRMGSIAYIAFAIVMGSSVLFSSLLGIFLGEWRGTRARTRWALALGLITLALSIALAVVAKNL